MTDATDQDTFVDFHRLAGAGLVQVARRIANVFEKQESRIAALEKDVARLEERATAHALDINRVFGKIASQDALK